MNQEQPPAATPSLTHVLYIPPSSETLSYKPHRDEVGGMTFLEWVVVRLRNLFGVTRLTVVYHGDGDRDLLRDIERRGGVTAHQTAHAEKLRAVAEVARDSSHVACLPFGVALAPHDLIERVCAHHLSCGNDYTAAHGFPLGSAPEVYNSGLLLSLATLSLPGLPSDPKAAVESLLSVARATGEAMIPINAHPFDAAASYQADSSELPERLTFVNPEDVEAVRAVSAAAPARDHLSTLREWKRATVRGGQTLRAELTRATSPGGARARPSAPLKVLYVSTPSVFSGAEQSLCQLVAHLDADRVKPSALVAMRGVFTERLERAGAEVICPERNLAADTVNNFLYALNVLKRIRPDVIHFNCASGTPALFAAAAAGVPLVQHVRVAELHQYGEQLRNADAIIAVSRFIKNEVVKFDVEPERVEVIFNGIDLEGFKRRHFDRARVREEFAIPPEAGVVLMIARFAPNKRHDLVLEAARRLRETVPSLCLVMVGEANENPAHFAAVREHVAASNLSGHVKFLGFQRDIRRIEAAADALVLCSDDEPLGRCIIEAMAMELPVVVTASGGNRELVTDGETGFVVPAGDSAALAARLEEVLTRPDLARRATTAARAFAEAELSAGLCARRVMDLYDRLAYGRAGRLLTALA